ncbi:50S ribosomal protein L1 [Smittium mucronatum]|uniref:50S ribosomal protein L1 n=1 Tax=Smittium mucronatum TaxID=133383 RepID=A0A1R0H960_9FUNG|nr:50S ribosomal protein L1 [Smittium mucronatum]
MEAGSKDSTIELHLKCRPEKGQHQIRGSFIMPNAFKKSGFLVVFAEGKQAIEAKEAGADLVGSQELIERIKSGELKFDKCISTTEVLPQVAKIARILGPKGLMPTINKGNVTDDVKNAVLYAKNSFEFKADKQFVVHAGT